MRKLTLTVAALALLGAPAFAAVPTAPAKHAHGIVLASAHKHHAKKSHGKKAHKKAKHGKHAKKSGESKSAVEAGNTSAGESLPPLQSAPITDNSAGPQ